MHFIEYIIFVFLIIFLYSHYSFLSLFHTRIKKIQSIYYDSVIDKSILEQNSKLLDENIMLLMNRTNQQLFNYKNTIISWTYEETEKLVSLRDELVSWIEISKQLNRSIHYCKSKYYSIQKELVLPFKWNVRIEKQLLKYIEQYEEDWQQISLAMDSKMSPYKCKQFYVRYLRSLKTEPWTLKDDSLLISSYTENIQYRSSSNLASRITSSDNKDIKDIEETVQDTADTDILKDSISIRTNDSILNSSHILSSDIPLIDNDLLLAYGQQSPAIWRNVSYVLNRHSIDCRRRFVQLAFNRDNNRYNSDTWYDGEIKYLVELVLKYYSNTNFNTFHIKEDNRLDEIIDVNQMNKSKEKNIKIINNDIERSNDINNNKVMNNNNNKKKKKKERNIPWSIIGRSLGRTPAQCYTAFYSSFKLSKEAIVNEYDLSSSSIIPKMKSMKHLNPSNDISFPSLSTLSPTSSPEIHYITKVIPQQRRIWDQEEDFQLIKYVQIYGNQWKQIGEQINRSNYQCFQRFQILKYKYNISDILTIPDEERHQYNLSFLEPIKTFNKKGKRISKIKTNSINNNKQYNYNSNKGWDDITYVKLYELVKEYGPKWTKIGILLNKTPYVCRSAYKRLLEKISIGINPNKKDLFQMPLSKYNIKNHKQLNKIDPNDMNLIINSNKFNILNHTNFINSSDEYTTSLSAWTKGEDERLRILVRNFGRKWSMIAEELKRSPEDVMLRYDFKITKQHKIGSWNHIEDSQLLKLVEQYGERWSIIGSKINRNGNQCALRYRLTLNPRLKWKLWTKNEDEQLMLLRDNNNYNWAMISATLDRAATSCRYRYLKLKKYL